MSDDRVPLSRRLGRLLGLARPYWKPLALGTVVLVISSGLNLAIPQALRVLVDDALSDGSMADINRTALILGAIGGLQAITSGLRYFIFTTTGERIVADLRRRLYERMVAQEIGFFDERRTGELVNRLASDTSVVQNAVSVNISMALRNAAQAIGGFVLLFYTSVELTVVMLLAVPPIAISATLFGKRIRKLSRAAQDALAEAGEVAEETLSGIRTVRAFAHEAKEAGRYGASVETSFDVAKKRIVNIAYFSSGASLFAFSAIALVMWYGGRIVVGGEMSVGELMSYILYTGIVAIAFGTLADLWTQFMRATGAAERLFDIIDREPHIENRGGDTPSDVDGRIHLDQVSFTYPSRPDVPVLREVSLEVAPGEVVALVGPSGSGKSMIASLVSRFYDPQEGRVLLDQHDIRDLDATWLRRQVGVVSQEPILFSTSVADNIRYGRSSATDEEVRAAARAANAESFIVDFPEGFDTQVGERGVQLSGGQKQRVAIARALLKDPKVLILDEATSALDAESESLVREALERLMQGRSTLVIAHRLSTVKDADRVLVVEKGAVVQTGSHGELMDDAQGTYRRLVEKQFVEAVFQAATPL
ncbi:MAG: ABC transporter transmembrane domain-containing protein, partial [Myxococcota bacterium]